MENIEKLVKEKQIRFAVISNNFKKTHLFLKISKVVFVDSYCIWFALCAVIAFIRQSVL